MRVISKIRKEQYQQKIRDWFEDEKSPSSEFFNLENDYPEWKFYFPIKVKWQGKIRELDYIKGRLTFI
jgi:hypothetical protein